MSTISPTMELTFEAVGVGGGGDGRRYVGRQANPDGMAAGGWEEQPQWQADHVWEVADEAAYRAPLEALLADDAAWLPEATGYTAGAGVVSYIDNAASPHGMAAGGWEEQPQWQADHVWEVADEAAYRAPPEAPLLDRGPWPVEPAGWTAAPVTETRLPSLDLLTDQVAAERETINSHTESLDIKAGLILGFSGVLVGLGATAQPAVSGRLVFQFGLAFAVLAALVAALSFVPRRFPVLQVARLRQSHLTAPTQETKRELLDTEIVMVEDAARLVKQKGLGLRVSAICLAIAAAQVVTGTLMASGGHSHHA